MLGCALSGAAPSSPYAVTVTLPVSLQSTHGTTRATNVANAFFYLLTSLHGLHLLGGLLFWGKTTSKLFKTDYEISKLQHRIELCAVYWHFLLAVWFVLFGLMLFT